MSDVRDRDVVLAMARGASAAVERSRERLNDLNVYPVPDGDTGSNLAATAAEVAAALDADPAADRERLAAVATRAALMGASGNSGAILSQIVRGLAAVLGSAERIDAAVLARALRAACDAAYRPVQQPIEGTMLTVIRVMAEEAERSTGLGLDEAVDRVLDAASDAVEHTPEMLDVLAAAGVVDAGAAGLVELARGAVAGLRGQAVEAPLAAIAAPLSIDAVHMEESRFRYCTAFLVAGDGIDGGALERTLQPLGDCLLVVGEPPLFKVHVHTDDPGSALSAATAIGGIDRVAIADMHAQTRERSDRLEGGAAHLTLIEGGRSERARPDGRLTAENTAIVLDSTAGLADPRSEHSNWRMVPLIVRFGERSYRDGVDIDADEFYRLLRAGGDHPTTAAPPPGAYLTAFEQLDAYAHVIVLPISSALSASSRSAQIAAADLAGPAGRVTVMDGLSASVGTALLADGIQRLLERGTTLQEIEAWFTAARDRMAFLISVDTLEYLRRGGRIGRVTATMGGLLDLHPLLTLRDGEVAQAGRVRGPRVLPAFQRFAAERIGENEPARIAIAHADAPERAARVAELVARVRPQARLERVGEIGAVVGAHGGPGTLGLVVLPGE